MVVLYIRRLVKMIMHIDNVLFLIMACYMLQNMYLCVKYTMNPLTKVQTLVAI